MSTLTEWQCTYCDGTEESQDDSALCVDCWRRVEDEDLVASGLGDFA